MAEEESLSGAAIGGGVGAYEHRAVNPARMSAVRAHAGRAVLDVGCGSAAYVLALMDEYSIVGIDHQAFPSWSSGPGRFAVIDADHLDGLRSDSVDTVLLFEVLEHLRYPEEVLRQARRICRKNVIVTVPNTDLSAGMRESRLIYFHWIDRTHVQFFNQTSLRELAERAGLRVDSIERINPISLAPFIIEAFALKRLSQFARRVISRAQQVQYEMTLLAVLSKSDS